MKMLLKEVQGDGCIPTRKRILPFKEFCQSVYEPTQRIMALNLTEEERLELEELIERRKRL